METPISKTPVTDLAKKLIETDFRSPEFNALMEARLALSDDNKTALFFAVLLEAKNNSPRPSLTLREGDNKHGKAA